MNKQHNVYIVFSLILISACFYNCSGQEQANVHRFVIDAKRAGISDEETAKLLMAYSILNNVSAEEAQKILMASEFLGLSNKTRSIDLNSRAEASNKSSSLLSVQRVLLILACLVVIGACSAYLYKEFERQYKEYQQYRAREDFKANVREVHDTVVQGVNDTYASVKAWWNRKSGQYSQPRQNVRHYR